MKRANLFGFRYTSFRFWLCVFFAFFVLILKVISYDIFSWSFVSAIFVALYSIVAIPYLFFREDERNDKDL